MPLSVPISGLSIETKINRIKLINSKLTSQIIGFRQTLLTLTRRFSNNTEERQDLVQDTLLKALMYGDKFREGTNLKGWLFTIMRNTFINNYRKSKLEKTLNDSAQSSRFLNIPEQHTFNRPHENMELQEIWSRVNDIKEEYLVPFKMHTMGYKYEEIATHLNIPVGTVKSRIFQARKDIQKNLHGYKRHTASLSKII
jgi:RNA polymerase sigma-70 factor (ECF subfamily)